MAEGCLSGETTNLLPGIDMTKNVIYINPPKVGDLIYWRLVDGKQKKGEHVGGICKLEREGEWTHNHRVTMSVIIQGAFQGKKG